MPHGAEHFFRTPVIIAVCIKVHTHSQTVAGVNFSEVGMAFEVSMP